MSEVRLIDANALRDLVSNMLVLKEKYGINFDILSVIDNAPAVEPFKPMCEAKCVRPQGEWIRYRDNPHQPEHIKCSNCGQYWSVADHDKTFNFCFNCGARMISSEKMNGGR